jgi:hypothetical protein
MTRTANTRTRTTLLAALLAASCALSLSPAALAAKDKGRDNGGERARDKQQAPNTGREPRTTKSDQHAKRERGTDDRHEGRDDRRGDRRSDRRSEERDGHRDDRRDRGSRPESRHDAPVCCAPAGAGILGVNGCSVRIGNNHKYKKIANAFKKAGYQAYVRNDGKTVSVRVYGNPNVEWCAGSYATHTRRQGSVLYIELCKIGR